MGINKHANPSIGSGYTISSGGEGYAGKSTWNFHWGGVIMESDDGKDKVVLENYATVVKNEKNKKWDFEMYGTLKDKQTFYQKQKNTGEHGESPTTMSIQTKTKL